MFACELEDILACLLRLSSVVKFKMLAFAQNVFAKMPCHFFPPLKPSVLLAV